jgi:hypothetical protein
MKCVVLSQNGFAKISEYYDPKVKSALLELAAAEKIAERLIREGAVWAEVREGEGDTEQRRLLARFSRTASGGVIRDKIEGSSGRESSTRRKTV